MTNKEKIAREQRLRQYKINMDEAYERAFNPGLTEPEVRTSYKNMYFYWKHVIEVLENDNR